MFEHWLPWILNLGGWAYVLLFAFSLGESLAVIGILVPGATFVVLFGFLISLHAFHFVDAVLVASVGAILGDSLSYWWGRSGIDPAKHFPKLFSPSAVCRAEKFMETYGIVGVFLGRFIGPLRPFVPFIAGVFKMRFRYFMMMNVTSGFLWALSYVALGFFFGQWWGSIHRGLRWIGIGILVILVVYIVFRIRRGRLMKMNDACRVETKE